MNLFTLDKTEFIFFRITSINHQNLITSLSSNFDFEDIIVGWYCDLLLGGNHSTDSTGIKNHLFAAYGLCTPST